MIYKKVLIIIIVTLLFSGCMDQIAGRFEQVQVVFVNVTVAEENNMSVIKNITAKGGEIPKIYAPGNVYPDKFPAIYAEVLQIYNTSKPGTYNSISYSYGQPFSGPGNYSFAVQLTVKALDNNNQTFLVYSEIVDNNSKRVSRANNLINLTRE